MPEGASASAHVVRRSETTVAAVGATENLTVAYRRTNCELMRAHAFACISRRAIQLAS